MQSKLRRQSPGPGSTVRAQEVRELVEVVRRLDATVQSMTPAAVEHDIQLAVRDAVRKVMDDPVHQITSQLEEQLRSFEERGKAVIPSMTVSEFEHVIQVAFSNTLRWVTDDREHQIASLLEQQSRFQHQLSQTNELLGYQRELLEALAGELLNPTSQRDAAPVRQAAPAPAADPEVPQSTPLRSNEPNAVVESRWQSRVAQGEALRAEWVKDKLLVPAVDFAKRWGRTRQALDQACERRELFSLKVGKNRYYPAAFLNLDAEAVKRVNLALKGDDVTAKFLFWQETFGALGGKSITEALAAGKVDRAEELALGWSEEHGFVNASAA